MYLNCHSWYSLRYGTFSDKTLLELGRQCGADTLVLTDINNTSGCLNFIRLAPSYGIRPIVGIDFRNGAECLYVGIAKNNEGFEELNTFLSNHSHSKTPFPEEAPDLDNAFFVYPFERVERMRKVVFKSDEYVGVGVKQLKRLAFSPLSSLRHKMVVWHPVSFRGKRDFNAHRLLRAIDNNTLLSMLSPSEQGQEWEQMMPVEQLEAYYEAHPYMIHNTQQLLEECEIHFDFSEHRRPQNQRTYTGSMREDQELLRQLCAEQLSYRYPKVSAKVRQRLEMELDMIGKMGFVSYFLINWDIVSYAAHKNYFHVGRGSGANSVVAYLLGITDVDPVELDLYFERFINLYRTSPPDFDIDFSWKDRADVTQYIFNRFPNTSLLATYNTFQYKGCVRELGKVFGLPKHEIDVLSRGKFQYDKLDSVSQLVIQYSELIHGVPNHLGIHAGGILISEKPIHHFSATDLPPKGFPTAQFDMVVAEDVGLYKFDILGQRGLAKIKDTLEVIRYNRPDEPEVDIHDVRSFKNDAKVNNLVKQARCLGCFYVESPAMRMLLKKLEVDNYLGLVAASSIIRPGVSRSGMMREYIMRHKFPERRSSAHPALLDLMEETYGVMVYQEDVIKVAHHFAGLSLAEADVLRRGMSGKYRSRVEFARIQDKFMQGCRDKGYPEELTQQVWKQIESFAGYAFAKGHSASYAVESYQSLYLKTYYPLEYMVAVLNNGGGFYRRETYIHEARMLGATIHAPCVNKSGALTLIYGKDIYLGFGMLKDLEHQSIERVLKARAIGGPFTSFEDFTERVNISVDQAALLIRIGALRSLEPSKRALLWKAHLQLNPKVEESPQQLLFTSGHSKQYDIPELHHSGEEDIFDQIELLGFSLESPFRILANPPEKQISAAEIPSFLGRSITIYAYLVTAKATRSSDGRRMFFGTFLDEAGDFVDTVHFPPVAARYPFRGKGVYTLFGKVVEEFGFYSLEVMTMEKMDYIPDPRYAEGNLKKHYQQDETKSVREITK